MDSYTTLLMISATVICDLETQPNIVLLVADDLGEYFTYKLKLKIIKEKGSFIIGGVVASNNLALMIINEPFLYRSE